eukprot:6657048-Pyramimonas_sp.AAC.1
MALAATALPGASGSHTGGRGGGGVKEDVDVKGKAPEVVDMTLKRRARLTKRLTSGPVNHWAEVLVGGEKEGKERWVHVDPVRQLVDKPEGVRARVRALYVLLSFL